MNIFGYELEPAEKRILFGAAFTSVGIGFTCLSLLQNNSLFSFFALFVLLIGLALIPLPIVDEWRSIVRGAILLVIIIAMVFEFSLAFISA